MKKIILSLILILGITNTNAQNFNTEMEKVSYSLGVNVAKSVKNQGLTSIDSDAIAQAFTDVFEGNDLKISEQESNVILQDFFGKLAKKAQSANVEAGQKFLSENAKRNGVVTTNTGLQYEVLVEGTGDSPKENDKVTVHYHGTLIDGTVFDSSVDRGKPATFPVNGVIPGWVEALQLMNQGAKYKLFIPSELAYGERGAGGSIGPNATLIFEVELISIGD
ncbi:MAG: peptidylprolyl isomerase [Flavobacteriales bacterium]|nr:peptidylprolyl isomerase [Flavobacteriales bacterium]|tara:strand:+ start:793 stop:1455 length:663 start_codon:yes stop_codon:yes gene_type:complete